MQRRTVADPGHYKAPGRKRSAGLSAWLPGSGLSAGQWRSGGHAGHESGGVSLEAFSSLEGFSASLSLCPVSYDVPGTAYYPPI